MISDKVTILNQVVLKCLNERDEQKVVKAFMDTGLKVLGADFGFVWLNSAISEKLELVYTTPNLPYTPHPPRKQGRNYKVITTFEPDFVVDVTKVPDAKYVTPYMKSFVILPIAYKQVTYGSMVFCFKEKETFPKEKKVLITFIGNSVAQAITIHRTVAQEREATLLSNRYEAYFHALVKNSHEVIMIVDQIGKILYISSSAPTIFGEKVNNMVGKNIKDFVLEDESKILSDHLHKVLSDPNTYHIAEFDYTNKDGIVRSLESKALNMLDNPNVKGIVVNIRDITERKKLEKLKETEILLREEELKTEFIANATHELRTPLSIIRGNVELATHKKAGLAPATAFKAIKGEIEHLSNIISDLALLTSKKTHPNDGVIYRQVDLKDVVSDVMHRCRPLAQKKGITFFIKKLPSIVTRGDRSYLEKMVSNLVNNSIVYGKKNGRTTVELRKEKNGAAIIVEDNGTGIGEEDLPHIFERFYRAEKSRTSSKGGTGLGLAIVKWVAELHGGEIFVKSKKNKGTTFTVKLPIIT